MCVAGGDQGGVSKTLMSSKILELLNFHLWIKSTSFNVWVKYFVWNFKGNLWNSTQNILPIHWKIWFLYNIEILRAFRFKSSYTFLKRTNAPTHPDPLTQHTPGYQPCLTTPSFRLNQLIINLSPMRFCGTNLRTGIHRNCPKYQFVKWNWKVHLWNYFYVSRGITNFVTSVSSLGPFYKHGLTLISAWISYHATNKVWDEITFPSSNFKSCTVEVWG